MDTKELKAQYKAGERNFQGISLRGANLTWMNLQGVDLRGADLSEANLSNANLSNANLGEGTNFAFADLSRATLHNTNLKGTVFEGANLAGVELQGSQYNEQTKFPNRFDPLSAGATPPAKTRQPKKKSTAVPQADHKSAQIHSPTPLPDHNALVQTYNANPSAIASAAEGVSETEASVHRRRRDSSITQVNLQKVSHYSYWIIVDAENHHWLVPKADLKLNSMNFDTFQSLFSYQGEPTDSTFHLNKPARVTPPNSAGEWELIERGEVQFKPLPAKIQPHENTSNSNTSNTNTSNAKHLNDIVQLNQRIENLRQSISTTEESLDTLSQSELFTNSSGQKQKSVVPAEITGWNWGAALLPLFWMFTNRIWGGLWLWLLAWLIPDWRQTIWVLSMIVFGAKGNEWAWKSRQWTSVAAFKKHQRYWAIAGFILWGLYLWTTFSGRK